MKVGDPHEEDTVVGPLISEAHRERVLGFVEQAVEEGATVATGGKVPEHLDKGWYVEPTLLTNVTNDMTVAQEEVFGPVIALIPYEDEEDAIRIANDSRFGLAGSVFTGDPARGFEIARRVRTGTFSVNTFAADFNSPFGGYKESGIGREHGPTAIEEYLLYKTISVDPSQELPDEVVRRGRARAGAGLSRPLGSPRREPVSSRPGPGSSSGSTSRPIRRVLTSSMSMPTPRVPM